MPFSMADPRIIDPIDVIADIDKRPNLLELTPKEFEAFIQNLLRYLTVFAGGSSQVEVFYRQ